MKKNGFIATSLLYTFFLAFIGLFAGMIAIYLQNRVYLIKLEDSSKNAIYIREMKQKIDNYDETKIKIKGSAVFGSEITLKSYINNIFVDEANEEYNLLKCEQIYYSGTHYYLEGCPTS